MALILADRVQQTGVANTTVSFTLSGSVNGFQSFTVVGNGNTTYYSAFDTSGNWETGLGTYSTTGPTLTRTTIYQSSNSNAAVTFSGTVNVFVTYPSGKAVNQDASGVVTINQLALGLSTQSVAIGQGNASIMKNRIINGAMVIDQRNAGAAVTAEGYLVDRWRVWRNQTYSIQQSTDAPAGFSNSLAVTKTSTSQSTYAYLVQYVEGFNFSDMSFGTANAKTVTISFWVKSSVTGTFSAGLINSASNRSYPATYTISSANTWTQASVTIAGDTSGTWVGSTNGTGVGVWFNFGGSGTATANAWNASDATSGVTGNANLGTTNGATFYITGVQLEVGSSATGFEYRQYGQELALCQRYFELWSNIGGNAGYMNFTWGAANATTQGTFSYNFLVQKRTNPSFAYSAVGDFAILYNGTTAPATCSAITLFGSNPTTIELQASTATTMTAYAIVSLAANNNGTTSKLSFSAEL